MIAASGRLGCATYNGQSIRRNGCRGERLRGPRSGVPLPNSLPRLNLCDTSPLTCGCSKRIAGGCRRQPFCRASLAIVNANDVRPRRADGNMPFYPNSDLFYLSGIEQEQTVLLMR